MEEMDKQSDEDIDSTCDQMTECQAITSKLNSMKVYAKDSMDRFGDDLTEEVIQYLTFNDKVRLECVSKQWQRCVYNKQFSIELVNYWSEEPNSLMKIISQNEELSKQRLTTFLKKCPNIKKVNLGKDVTTELLSLFGQYCNRIKSLMCYQSIGSDEYVLSFFRMNGHKLEELRLKEDNKDMKQYLKFCLNLKKVYIPDISVLFNDDIKFLPKLEYISTHLYIHPKDINRLKILSDKYRQTMKTIDLRLSKLTDEELKTCIDYICRFENLKELKLEFYALKVEEPIENSLSLIGQKCNKLLKLDLEIDYCVQISDTFFNTFSEFTAIKKLKIELLSVRAVKGSIESLKHCKQLNELDIRYRYLREDFFANIATFVPKLRSLRVETEQRFSETFHILFYSMKNVEKVKIFFDNDRNERIEKFWYFSKKLYEVMSSAKGKDVKRVNDNCGLITINGYSSP